MKYVFSLMFFFAIHHLLIAQGFFNSDISAMYDNNIDNNYLQITDKITSGLIDIGYLWRKEKYEISTSYTGSINYYTKLTDRTNYSHQFQIDYIQSLDEEGSTNLDASAGISSRIDREVYVLYDHTIFHGNINLEHYLSDATIFESNYYFQLVRFKNLSDFNHTEHNLGIQFSLSFETKTSLILKADYGMKIYASENSTTTSSGNNGYGQGQGNAHLTTNIQTSSPSVSQISGLVRIGQSILENTGISFAAQYQTNLKKESRYFASSYGPIPDDVIFDDHYGYNGLLISLMLTQVLPFNSRVRIIFSRQNREYSSLQAYDLDWNLVSNKRNDKRTVYSFQFRKNFDSIGLSIMATYDYIVNSSNDLFYDYVNNAMMIKLSVEI